MKRLNLIIVFLILSVTIMAQEDKQNKEIKTLIGDRNIKHGGYFGVTFGYSQMDQSDVLFFGGRGMWILNHGMGIGLGGSGFANELFIQNDIYTNDDKAALSGGYGGLILEPILFPKSPIHVSFPILLGAGGISSFGYYSIDDYSYHPTYEKAYFIAEPSIELEFNMVKFMRIALGGSYRVTTDINIPEIDSDVLNGFSGNLTLKFGWF